MTAIQLTEQQKQALERVGYGLNGDIGGLLRNTYYTPDGRTIRAIPSLHTYVKKDAQGKVIETGQRDANLDQGWLLQKPTVLKPHCRTCNRWHDTQEGVEECAARRKAFMNSLSKEVEAEKAAIENDRIAVLERQVRDLIALLRKSGGAHGTILQSTDTQQTGPSASGNGKAEVTVQ